MSIENFDQLLQMARQQPQPQKLLFVFANAELPDGASVEQRAGFESGQGSALVPQMCVDKRPEDISSFATLVDESLKNACPWSIVFVAALSGQGGASPTDADAQACLDRMVEKIRQGDLGTLIPFDKQGHTVVLSRAD